MRFVSMNILRESYPRSRYRYSALLTIGEVYLRDLNDPENARATFGQFLKLYPQSPLAAEARIELSNLRHAPHSVHANAAVAQNEVPASIPATAKTSTHPSGHHNVPDEAGLSPQGEPQTAKTARAVRKSSNPQHE